MPKFLNFFTIKINGQNVSESFYDSLIEAVVDRSLNMPGMFTLRLQDADLTWVDDALLAIGKTVEIEAVLDETATQSPSSAAASLIKGEITALEPHFSSDGGTEMMVRGYDKSHRLHRGAKTRTFLKSTDSDIFRKIASESGLNARVDATTDVYDFVMQFNQTNYEFLMMRAERIGYRFTAAGGDISLEKGAAEFKAGPELRYGEELFSFEPRWSALNQVNKMKVRGWDAKTKQAIVNETQPNSAFNQGGMNKTGSALSQVFGAAEAVSIHRPVDSVGQAKSLAEGMSVDRSLGFVQAEGICAGNPKVQPGFSVQIKNVGTRFGGKYFVTSATHLYNANGYETHFTISGRNPNTLINLVSANEQNGSAYGQVQGVVTALVTNLNDPEDRGRIKVKYPWLDDSVESDWMRIAVPMAGNGRGTLLLPEVGDEVLVAFEQGDIHHPYMVGAVWSNTDKPPLKNAIAVQGGKVNQRIFKTRQGHMVTFNDKDGEEQISIQSKSGHSLVLNDKSGSENIQIKDKSGRNSITIDSSKNSMTIKVGGDFLVEATGKITMKSTGAMNLEAVGDAKMKGMNAAVEGSIKSELKAATVSVNGSAQAELKGGGIVTVQGALVKIN